MLITIDEYYGIDFYNECRQALTNNGIAYKEYIAVKSPYNWYLDIPSTPIMVNYDVITNAQERFIVNKVEAALPNEEYILQRRQSDAGKSALVTYTLNKPLLEAQNSDYACFFNARNREQLTELSKTLGKIYYFGRYYNKFKVALCYNKMIKNYVDASEILTEKETSVYQMELDLNYKVFKLNDRLRKFTNTPSFENGAYNPVKIQQFNLHL